MTAPNADQASYWNGDEGSHWVVDQRRYEEMLEPMIDVLLDAARIDVGDHVLDVGCGCGATTIAVARVVGSDGSATGVDLSGPMLERARMAADSSGLANIALEQADAQVVPFEPGAYDAIVSRFGVMFFDDPSAAFANLRRAARSGAHLAFIAWRSVAENEWFRLPMRTLSEFVPPDERPPADLGSGPGPFAFADDGFVRTMLTGAGWRDVDVSPRDVPILYGGKGTVDDILQFVANGRAGKTFLGRLDDRARAAALDALRRALEPYVVDEGVRFTAAAWVVTAVA